MAQRTKHLQIPATRSADVQQQKFNDAVRQQLNMLGGTKLDRALTLRDLTAGVLKGIKLTGAIIDAGAQPGGGNDGDVDTPDAPTVPTNVQGHAGVDATFLKWDRPTFRGYAYTEIYRFGADSLALAQRVSTSSQPMFSEYVGYGSDLYYWVRHVNTAGDVSAFHATQGIHLQTKPDYEAIQDALSEQINESYLAASLRARIDLIDLTDNGGLKAKITTLETTAAGQANRLSALEADNGSTKSRLVTLETADADKAERIQQLSFQQDPVPRSALVSEASWVIGTQSDQPGFPAAGNAEENHIITGVGPYGTTAKIWKATSLGGQADGGWNGVPFAIDRTKTYRFSVWFKLPVAATSGTVYLGCGTVQTLAGVLNSNPYFYSGSLHRSHPGKWLLCVGYIHPEGYAGAPMADSGVYDAITGARLASAVDFRFPPGHVSTLHRAFQYYTTTDNIEVYFAHPRVDVLEDGAPPLELLLRSAPYAAVQDVARAYTDSQTGELRAERTIKVESDGKVAGIGLLAGPVSGSQLYFSADQIAFVKPGAPVAGAIAPFVYDAQSDTTYLNVAFIRDLTASKISGGVLNLNDGNIRNLTVFESFNPPDQFLQKAHFSDKLARELAWVDPNAVATGGTLSKDVYTDSGTTAMGGFLSGGQAPTVKVSADIAGGYSNVLTSPISGYIEVQILRNNTVVTVDGVSTFRINVASYLITDEAAPPSQRRWSAYCEGGVNGVCAAVANNTTTNWAVKVVGTSGLGASATAFVVRATVFEAFGSSGGLIANTTWTAISDKPATATRWPTFAEVTGTLSESALPVHHHSTLRGNAPINFLQLSDNNAQGINIGQLLVSNAYADVGKVPTNGAFIKGRVYAEGGFSCNNLQDDSLNHSFEVYSATGGVRYGMTLWNTNGTTGSWGTMIYGPLQSNRRISFGKVNTSNPSNFSHISEIAHFDLDNGDLNVNSAIQGGRIYAGWDAGVAGSISTDRWFRSSGNSGWFNSTYSGGIWMTDTTWVRVYNGKKFYVENTAADAINTAGGLTVVKGVTSHNGGGSWLSQLTADNIPLDSQLNNSSAGSSYAAVVRQRHNDMTFTVGGLARRYFGFFSYLNSRSVNGTDGSFYMDVNGNCTASGTITALDCISTSDRRTKRRLKPINNALARIGQLTGYTFTRKGHKGREAGYIAQDLQKVLPQGVTELDGILRVSNSAVIGLLIQAVNELAGKVAKLEAGS